MTQEEDAFKNYENLQKRVPVCEVKTLNFLFDKRSVPIVLDREIGISQQKKSNRYHIDSAMKRHVQTLPVQASQETLQTANLSFLMISNLEG